MLAFASTLPGLSGVDLTHEVPDIMEFVTSPRYLNRPNLYPRQATILKIIFLQSELFTDYDLEVIREWEEQYQYTADENGEGNNGVAPGTLERIRVNRLCPCGHDRGFHTHDPRGLRGKDGEILPGMACSVCECDYYRGRFWFREVVSAIGRRGSKGHVGALATAYVLWHYIAKGDPQGFYGVDRDKRLTAIVFAGKKEQAKANQWADIYNVLLGAPCYESLISRPHGESITIRSPYDEYRLRKRLGSGIKSTADIATFEIIPKESTVIAGRGYASFLQVYDEAAHVVKGTARSPAEDVYESATPALDQFGLDGFIYIPSSPWQRIGLFHDKYQEAREVDEDGTPIYPEKMMFQLTSWDPYTDWERAHDIPLKPLDQFSPDELADIAAGRMTPCFKRLRGAIQSYDDQMRQIERANPETFKVERRSQFAAVLDAYLNPDRIRTIWEPWPTENDALTMKAQGKLSMTYRAHGDPSKSGANFGFAIGHIESYDDRGLPHVVFDVIHNWDPATFEDHQIDYDQIGRELEGYLDSFMPAEMTFDQFNSVSTIQRLQRYVRSRKYPKTVQVYERPATGPLNWKTYETFKTALGLGLIHAPFHELANLELTFLQDLGGKVDCPDSGPVQTKDVADCMAIVVYELIGDEMASLIGKSLGEVLPSASQSGGFDPYPRQMQREAAHEALSSFGRRGRRLPYRKV